MVWHLQLLEENPNKWIKLKCFKLAETCKHLSIYHIIWFGKEKSGPQPSKTHFVLFFTCLRAKTQRVFLSYRLKFSGNYFFTISWPLIKKKVCLSLQRIILAYTGLILVCLRTRTQGVYLFNWLKFLGNYSFTLKWQKKKEKRIPWPLKTNFCPIEAILSCLRVEAQRKFIYNWIEFSSNYFLPRFDKKKLVLSLRRSILAQFRAIFGLLNRPKLSL